MATAFLSPIDPSVNADTCCQFLRDYHGYKRDGIVDSVDSWKKFIVASKFHRRVYLIEFRDTNGDTVVYAWGTASGDGARLKKSAMLDMKLRGKYDRRGEYLMLRAFFKEPLQQFLNLRWKLQNQSRHGKRLSAKVHVFLVSAATIVMEWPEVRLKSSNCLATGEMQTHKIRSCSTSLSMSSIWLS